ncbi:UDP-N-acetylmuramate dehydrogenase [Streptomyces sp. ISL-86]|uniref:UDP-N-acetylmuramate dehydrogenase n=1 Tax=Streptomyces sp. ISL-86 TaxID=2819187 RepID=UPI001BE5E404|nr:UDP-N-acetylmuramate dehydrogenase [Streptomyces sp. ISL-86]MBT2456495.1 UDP-N-acetylmuramate dehydrogenase [Streptomyces sp. ISL-86]
MGELLADHTTLRLGGPAPHWFTHADPATWRDLARAVHRTPGRPFTLGGGSNTLAADSGYNGPVIRMATTGISTRALDHTTVEVTAQAGEDLSSLALWTVSEGLSGIEYLAGIPGTIGAAPVQNTGAYGQQIADALTRVTAYDWRTGRTLRLPPTACAFGYRTSTFKTHPGRFTILSVTLHLTRSPLAAPVTYVHLADHLGTPLATRPPLTEAANAVLTHRAERGLLIPESGPDSRQAGSVFLNPTVTHVQAVSIRTAGGPLYRGSDSQLRASAGWLLEHAGHRPGQQLAPGIRCSSRRTLTLTAVSPTTASAYAAVVGSLAKRAYNAHGVQLRPELFCMDLWP